VNILNTWKSYNTYYRYRLGLFLETTLTNFSNEIFYLLQSDEKEEIWLRRIVFDLEEKYFQEYWLSNYKWKKVWFFTWTFIKEDYRKKWYWTDMFNIWLEKFKELGQDYVFSDARETSLNIFLKNWFKIIWKIISPEWHKEIIVIKKL